MIEIGIPKVALRNLEMACQDAGKSVAQKTSSAINKTAGKGKTFIAKGVTEELNVTQKVVKEHIDQPAKSNRNTLTTRLILRKSDRIELKDFKARQTKKGVSYKINDRDGTKRIPGSFIVARYGGNVFKRPGAGRATGHRKRGPSPWGVFVKRKMRQPIEEQLKAELAKQIDDAATEVRKRLEGIIK